MGHTRGDPLNASYHTGKQYIWFRGGYLKGFCDKRSFIKRKGWGMPQKDSQSVSLDVSYPKEQKYI